MFDDIILKDFWDDSNYSEENYHSSDFTDALLQDIENELGYKLPQSYVELMKKHNGGLVNRDCCPCDKPTSWAEDHICISGIMGVGREKEYSLCGALGSQFMIDEWEYPAIGVAICDTPSAGHDMVFLDYRECGPNGEPCVVHVDQERNYDITKLADSFEEFIKKLCIINKEDGSQVEGLVSGGMKVTDKLLEALAKIKSNQ